MYGKSVRKKKTSTTSRGGGGGGKGHKNQEVVENYDPWAQVSPSLGGGGPSPFDNDAFDALGPSRAENARGARAGQGGGRRNSDNDDDFADDDDDYLERYHHGGVGNDDNDDEESMDGFSHDGGQQQQHGGVVGKSYSPPLSPPDEALASFSISPSVSPSSSWHKDAGQSYTHDNKTPATTKKTSGEVVEKDDEDSQQGGDESSGGGTGREHSIGDVYGSGGGGVEGNNGDDMSSVTSASVASKQQNYAIHPQVQMSHAAWPNNIPILETTTTSSSRDHHDEDDNNNRKDVDKSNSGVAVTEIGGGGEEEEEGSNDDDDDDDEDEDRVDEEEFQERLRHLVGMLSEINGTGPPPPPVNLDDEYESDGSEDSDDDDETEDVTSKLDKVVLNLIDQLAEATGRNKSAESAGLSPQRGLRGIDLVHTPGGASTLPGMSRTFDDGDDLRVLSPEDDDKNAPPGLSTGGGGTSGSMDSAEFFKSKSESLSWAKTDEGGTTDDDGGDYDKKVSGGGGSPSSTSSSTRNESGRNASLLKTKSGLMGDLDEFDADLDATVGPKRGSSVGTTTTSHQKTLGDIGGVPSRSSSYDEDGKFSMTKHFLSSSKTSKASGTSAAVPSETATEDDENRKTSVTLEDDAMTTSKILALAKPSSKASRAFDAQTRLAQISKTSSAVSSANPNLYTNVAESFLRNSSEVPPPMPPSGRKNIFGDNEDPSKIGGAADSDDESSIFSSDEDISLYSGHSGSRGGGKKFWKKKKKRSKGPDGGGGASGPSPILGGRGRKKTKEQEGGGGGSGSGSGRQRSGSVQKQQKAKTLPPLARQRKEHLAREKEAEPSLLSSVDAGASSSGDANDTAASRGGGGGALNMGSMLDGSPGRMGVGCCTAAVTSTALTVYGDSPKSGGIRGSYSFTPILVDPPSIEREGGGKEGGGSSGQKSAAESRIMALAAPNENIRKSRSTPRGVGAGAIYSPGSGEGSVASSLCWASGTPTRDSLRQLRAESPETFNKLKPSDFVMPDDGMLDDAGFLLSNTGDDGFGGLLGGDGGVGLNAAVSQILSPTEADSGSGRPPPSGTEGKSSKATFYRSKKDKSGAFPAPLDTKSDGKRSRSISRSRSTAGERSRSQSRGRSKSKSRVSRSKSLTRGRSKSRNKDYSSSAATDDEENAVHVDAADQKMEGDFAADGINISPDPSTRSGRTAHSQKTSSTNGGGSAIAGPFPDNAPVGMDGPVSGGGGGGADIFAEMGKDIDFFFNSNMGEDDEDAEDNGLLNGGGSSGGGNGGNSAGPHNRSGSTTNMKSVLTSLSSSFRQSSKSKGTGASSGVGGSGTGGVVTGGKRKEKKKDFRSLGKKDDGKKMMELVPSGDYSEEDVTFNRESYGQWETLAVVPMSEFQPNKLETGAVNPERSNASSKGSKTDKSFPLAAHNDARPFPAPHKSKRAHDATNQEWKQANTPDVSGFGPSEKDRNNATGTPEWSFQGPPPAVEAPMKSSNDQRSDGVRAASKKKPAIDNDGFLVAYPSPAREGDKSSVFRTKDDSWWNNSSSSQAGRGNSASPQKRGVGPSGGKKQSDDPWGSGGNFFPGKTPERPTSQSSMGSNGSPIRTAEDEALLMKRKKSLMASASAQVGRVDAAGNRRRPAAASSVSGAANSTAGPDLEATRIDAVEQAAKRRIEMLKKMIAEKAKAEAASAARGGGASDSTSGVGGSSSEEMMGQLAFIEQETLKQISRVRNRMDHQERRPSQRVLLNKVGGVAPMKKK